MDATQASNYPPEQWNAYGQYLWWWVPPKILKKQTINMFGVPMTGTATEPYTFTATGRPEGLFFTKAWFGNDGYTTEFSAKDSETGLSLAPGDFVFQNLTTVEGLEYYRNIMGKATPVIQRKPKMTPIVVPLLLNQL